MAQLNRWIWEEAKGEPIEAVVIGQMGWGDYGKETVPGYDTKPRGKVLSWTEAEPLLSYDFDPGFGAHGCEAICAWTQSLVISVYQCDGSTGIFSVPRHPAPCMPRMPGG